jgi:hypothetical protein
MVGEIGGAEEEKAAEFIGADMTKPVVGYIAGFSAPPGKTMGHAGAIISGTAGTAEGKKEALEANGVRVGTTPTEAAELAAEVASAVRTLGHRRKGSSRPQRASPSRGANRSDGVNGGASSSLERGRAGVWQSGSVRPLAALYRVIFGSDTDPALRPILGINFAGSLAGSTVWSFVGIWAIKKLGADPSVLGLAYLVSALIGVGSGYLGGHLSDHFGRRPLILIGWVG